jgi:hypothetical protein
VCACGFVIWAREEMAADEADAVDMVESVRARSAIDFVGGVTVAKDDEVGGTGRVAADRVDETDPLRLDE